MARAATAVTDQEAAVPWLELSLTRRQQCHGLKDQLIPALVSTRHRALPTEPQERSRMPGMSKGKLP